MHPELARMPVELARRTSRRSFLGKVGRAVVALAGGSFVAVALAPERAEAHHICGHLYTTGSCPHPFAPLTRVDAFGYPVHPVVRNPRYGGGWSRCCGGRVRHIQDCCSSSRIRINGDASVRGYCPDALRVFCIAYRELNVAC